jgi:hypothetical protein
MARLLSAELVGLTSNTEQELTRDFCRDGFAVSEAVGRQQVQKAMIAVRKLFIS